MREKDYPGTFIVIEGADGTGTTTQSEKLAEKLDAHWTHEPTDNKIGEKVDEMISSDDYSAEAISLAFAADRLVHLEEEIVPKLKNGETVVCDRYYHSSLVYQSAIGADYDWIIELNKEMLKPDITIVLDLSLEKSLSRVEKRESDSPLADRDFDSDDKQVNLDHFSKEEGDDHIFEEPSFQKKVHQGYKRLSSSLEDVEAVDASGSKKEVFDRVYSKVEPVL